MTTFHWDAYTLLRLLFLFIIGILSYHFLPSLPISVPTLLFNLFVGIIVHWQLKRYLALDYKWIFGVVVALFWIHLGYFLSHNATDSLQANYFFNFVESNAAYLVRLNEPLRETNKTYSTTCSVLASIDSNGNKQATMGKLLVYFRKDSLSQRLQYGDQIVIANNRIQPIDRPLNPHQFDYAAYLAKQNIFHNCFLKTTDWRTLSYNDGKTFWKTIFTIRQYLIDNLRKYVSGETESGVAIGLLLGYRHYLERDIITTYSATGVTHILSVSGLHVGLVMAFLLLFFGLLQRITTTNLKTISTISVIFFVWLFIFLSGAPPSALRAGFMATFVLLARLVSYHSNNYNVIAMSAFLLLLYNPNFLYDLGFQLSYLAILSLAIFYRPIESLYTPHSWLANHIWQIFAMSMAAQILTFPISLYYFHQFPLFFLLSNIVAIPLSSAIVWLGVFFGLFSCIPFIGYWLGQILSYCIAIMNTCLAAIQKIPFANIDSIMINQAQLLLLYVAIFAIGRFFLLPLERNYHAIRPRYLQLALVALIGIGCISAWRIIHHFDQQSITLYAIGKQSSLEFVAGKKAVLLNEPPLSHQNFQYYIAQNHQQRGIRNRYAVTYNDLDSTFIAHPQFKNLLYNRYIMQFGDKTILRLPSKWQADSLTTPIAANYLLWSHNAKADIAQIRQQIQFDTLLIDASNSSWRTQQLVKTCDSLQIPYYNLSTRGAWQLHL